MTENPKECVVRLTTELIDACRSKDAVRVRALLEAGASPHLREPNGNMAADLPVHAAADAGSVECLQLLLDRHANINAVGRYGSTPLTRSVNSHRTACAEFLLEHGATVRAADESGLTALHYAAFHGITELLPPLLAAGAYVDEPAIPWTGQGSGDTPLMSACSMDEVAFAKALLEAGATRDYRTPEGRSAFTAAAKAPGTDCLNMLIKSNADLQAPRNSASPLYIAIDADRTENVRLLLPLETDLETLESAAIHAVGMGNTEIVRLFLDDPRADGYIGKMLETCMERDYSSTETAHMVLDAGAYKRAAPESAEAFLRRLIFQSGDNTGVILARVVRENDIDLNTLPGFDRVPIEVVAGDYLDPDRVALLMDLGADPRLASDPTVYEQDPKMAQMVRAFIAARAIDQVLHSPKTRNTL